MVKTLTLVSVILLNYPEEAMRIAAGLVSNINGSARVSRDIVLDTSSDIQPFPQPDKPASIIWAGIRFCCYRSPPTAISNQNKSQFQHR